MKIRGMMIILVGFLFLFIPTQTIYGISRQQAQVVGRVIDNQAVQTPGFTETTTISEETPEERILPPVGGNAGLVLGASILVLIIIGGVLLTSRRKVKH